MSELKAMPVLNVQQMGCYDNTLVYFKSEVDKVLAELEAENERLKDTLGGTNIAYKQCYDEYKQCDKELRHHKYKRCLDKARWCEAEGCWYENQEEDIKASWFFKWEHKWQELAEKFKETK